MPALRQHALQRGGVCVRRTRAPEARSSLPDTGTELVQTPRFTEERQSRMLQLAAEMARGDHIADEKLRLEVCFLLRDALMDLRGVPLEPRGLRLN